MFIVSVLLILISSYFLLSTICKKTDFKNNLGFIFYILIIFSQIVFSCELLSLFKILNRNNFFIVNILFCCCALGFWVKNGFYCYKPLIFQEFRRISNAIKQDKCLLFLSCCFLVFMVSALVVALFFPVRYADALAYYFSRCTMWVQNMGISHYITTDTRELIMPVNSELLYMWVMLFLKNEIGTGIFPYIFLINAQYVMYNLLGELGFCIRKRLWCIFVVSSFALIFVEASIPGGDLWTGSLILTCIYLFFCASKYDKKIVLYFASLALALAFGVKTTALISFPSVFALILTIAVIFSKEKTKVRILSFLGFLIINFLIFSSYNYILNFIDFQNPISDKSQFLINSFRGGVKGYISNLAKYIFAMFDFSGMPDLFNLGKAVETLQGKVLSLLNIKIDDYTSPFFPQLFKYNSSISVTNSMLGFAGLLTFYPSLLFAIASGIKNNISKKRKIIALLALFYVINILIFSRVMVYTNFNMRYLLTFAIVSSPVVVYTYFKHTNVYKILISIILFIYLAVITHTNIVAIITNYVKYKSMPVAEQVTDRSFMIKDCDEILVRRYFLNKEKSAIGMILQFYHPVYYINKLRLDGYTLETVLPEIITTYDLSKFDYLIISKGFIISNTIKNFQFDSQIPNISECVYKNFNRDIITPDKDEVPVIVTCSAPLQYILNNGFEIVNDFNSNSYWILRNKNNH